MVVESNAFSGDQSGGELKRVSGLYARFLPEVGYDFCLSLIILFRKSRSIAGV